MGATSVATLALSKPTNALALPHHWLGIASLIVELLLSSISIRHVSTHLHSELVLSTHVRLLLLLLLLLHHEELVEGLIHILTRLLSLVRHLVVLVRLGSTCSSESSLEGHAHILVPLRVLVLVWHLPHVLESRVSIGPLVISIGLGSSASIVPDHCIWLHSIERLLCKLVRLLSCIVLVVSCSPHHHVIVLGS